MADMAVRRLGWPWLFLCLIPVGLVVLADAAGLDYLIGKPLQETISVPLMAVVTLVWAVRARRERSVFFALLAAQALVFTMREIHFRGTSDGVYIGTAIIGLVSLRLAWRTDWEQVLPKIDWRLITALAVTAATYAVALLIQRRVFKGVPGEARLHVPLEEVFETFAHLWFLIKIGRASCRERV